MFRLTFYGINGIFSRGLLNEIVISSGNETDTHFSVTYETESRALATR